MGKMRLFHMVLVVMQIASHIHTFCTSGSLVGLLFELGGRMHGEIKGKIRWKDRNGEIVVE